MLAATQGGLAFSNASVCLVHGMSRPIGAHFHVPHGLSNAMLLPAVTAFSAPAALDRYADCARAMRVADETVGNQAAVAALIEELRTLNADLNVPTPRAYGIAESRYADLMPTMARQALDSGSPGNNPRVPTADEIVCALPRCVGLMAVWRRGAFPARVPRAKGGRTPVVNQTRLRRALAAAWAFSCLASGLSGPAAAETLVFMTGPAGGTWFPLGGATKQILEQEIDGLDVRMRPGAGLINIKAISLGKADIAWGNVISTVDALAGKPPFDEPMTGICNMAALYLQAAQIAVTDRRIAGIADLRGRELATLPRGNTTEYAARALPRGPRPDLRRPRQDQLRLDHRPGEHGEGRPGRRLPDRELRARGRGARPRHVARRGAAAGLRRRVRRPVREQPGLAADRDSRRHLSGAGRGGPQRRLLDAPDGELRLGLGRPRLRHYPGARRARPRARRRHRAARGLRRRGDGGRRRRSVPSRRGCASIAKQASCRPAGAAEIPA